MCELRMSIGNVLWRLCLGLLLLACVALSTPVFAQGSSFIITTLVEDTTQGRISPSGAVRAQAGDTLTFLIIPNPGYQVAYVQVDGSSVATTTSYTFTKISADHAISAGFAPATYSIKPSFGPNGTMSPKSSLRVQHGDNLTFTITPNEGFVADVVVDGVSQGSLKTYTFSAVDRDHTIAVTFAVPPPTTARTTTAAKTSPSLAVGKGPSIGLPLSGSQLASLLGGIVGAAAMCGVLVLRVRERRARPKANEATFVVRDLEISPKELRRGANAVIAVTVNNRGLHAGTFRVALKIDGITKTAKEVTLARGTSDRIEFSVPVANPGSFAVNVGDLSGTLTVL